MGLWVWEAADAHPSETDTCFPVFLEPLVADGMSFKNHKRINVSFVRRLELRGNSSLFSMIPLPGDFNLFEDLGLVFLSKKIFCQTP